MNLEPFLNASLAVQIHMLAAIGALVLGAMVLWRRKGGTAHKVNGRIWVALMMVTALSGFFIHEIRVWGNFSPIHIFSIVVPISLARAIFAIKRGRVREHKLAIHGTYFGLVAAGFFTLLPGRVPFEMFFGQNTSSMGDPLNWLMPLIVAVCIASLIGRGAWARRNQTAPKIQVNEPGNTK